MDHQPPSPEQSDASNLLAAPSSFPEPSHPHVTVAQDVDKLAGGSVTGSKIGEISGTATIQTETIIHKIENINQRALSAAEEAEQRRAFDTKRLAEGVSAFAQRLQARARVAGDARGSPYKGLLEFRLSDASVFFGRDEAIRDLLVHLSNAPLTVLHSESGAGKTSLLQAGISPRLIAANDLQLYLRPYRHNPSLVIKRAFSTDAETPLSIANAPLRDFLRQVSGVLGATTLHILLDQFEEFFTQLDETERAKFVNELAECLEDQSLNVRWLLALRSEYFGNLANFRPRIRNPFENDYRLNRLTRAEAQDGIIMPAAQRGITYEDGLVSTILDDLGKNEIAPPQLQLVCTSLYDELSPGETMITRVLYEREGRAAGILRGHLERVLSRDLPASERVAARRLLESLITSEAQRVIRTHKELVNELSKQGVTPQTLDAILNQLVDSRLLSIRESETEPAYELAHDYLLDEIKLDPEVQARKAAQELLEQEVRAYRRYKTLISSDRLKAIEPYYNDLVLTSEAKMLLNESAAVAQKEAADREEQRQRELEATRKLLETEKQRAQEQTRSAALLRQRALLLAAVLGIAVLLGITAGAFGIQSNEAANKNATLAAENASVASAAKTGEARAGVAEREARARLLVTQGEQIFEGDPLLGIRLGLEGLIISPVEDSPTRLLLTQSIAHLVAQGHVLNLGNDVERIVPSPDRSTLIVDHAKAQSDFRTADGALIAKLPGNMREVVFSPNPAANYFVISYSDAPSELRRTTDGKLITQLSGNMIVVAFSNDPGASYIAILYSDNIRPIELRRTSDGALVSFSGNVRDVDFSPSPGSYFAISYSNGPSELRRTADGALITRLSGKASETYFSPSPAGYLIVSYLSAIPSELRRTADGQLVTQLSGSIPYHSVDFSPDLMASYFVAKYDEGPTELRRTADGALITPLSGKVTHVDFSPGPTASYFLVEYSNAPSELRRTADGALITKLAGKVVSVDVSRAPAASYFVLSYSDSPSEVRRISDGGIVSFSGGVVSSRLPSGYFLVDYSERPGELRRIADGALITPLSGKISNMYFSPGPASYFVVSYLSEIPSELRRTADGQLVARLSGSAAYHSVGFSSDPATSNFVVSYSNAPSELRRTADGALVTQLSGKVEEPDVNLRFSPDSPPTYSIVSYSDGSSELWKVRGNPVRLATLGLGLRADATQPDPSKPNYLFDSKGRRLVLKYSDSRAYVLDLELLNALGGDSIKLKPDDLISLTCKYLFAPGAYNLDESNLQPYLNGNPPRACH